MDDRDQICPECGEAVSEELFDAVNMTEVIHRSETENSFCIHCGERLDADAAFCYGCGQVIQLYSPEENPVSPKAESPSFSNQTYSENVEVSHSKNGSWEPLKQTNKASSSKSKTIIIAVVLSVVFLAIGTGVFIFLQGNNTKDSSPTRQQTSKERETAAEQDEEDDEDLTDIDQEEMELAIELIDSMFDDSGLLKDTVLITDIDAAVNQVEILADNSDRDVLFKKLELIRQLLDTRDMVYALLENGFLGMHVNKITLDNALRKIENLPEEENLYMAKLKDVYNQAQVQFERYAAADEAVSILIAREQAGETPTREDYNQVKLLVDEIKNVNSRDPLIAQLSLVENAIMEREKQALEPSEPSGFDVEAGVLHVRAVYNFITQNQSSMQVTQLGNGAVWFEDAENGYAKMEVAAESGDMQNYSRFYYYENGELIFAFYFRGTLEHRFYFIDGALFRWIDEAYTIRDLAFDHSLWRAWETEVKLVGVR